MHRGEVLLRYSSLACTSSNSVSIRRRILFVIHKTKHPLKCSFSGMEVSDISNKCGRREFSTDKSIHGF